MRAPPDSIVMPSSWRRRRVAIIVALLAGSGILLDRLVRQPRPGGDWERYHDQAFRVDRIIDGDTLDIVAPDGQKPVTRLRLWGVDTPETKSDRGPAAHFGAEARQFAERTLEERTVHLVLSPRRTRDKYGRLLAYVYLSRGGRMFNEMLLEEGFAYADLRFDHHDFKQFQSIEKQARRERRGLWAEVTPEQMPAWRKRFETATEVDDNPDDP